MKLKEIQPIEFPTNPFMAIGREWALLTAARGDAVNTMTVSWGGMGVLWGADVVFVFVRKSRYTKEFMDASDTFSLSFYPKAERAKLKYLGAVSGRDEDKIAKAGFHVERGEAAPYFAEAKAVLVCTKLARFPLPPEGMIDPSIVPQWYAGSDWHDLYIGRIDKALVAEA